MRSNGSIQEGENIDGGELAVGQEKSTESAAAAVARPEGEQEEDKKEEEEDLEQQSEVDV